ncbi:MULTISPECIES: hypothetical protein [Pedobacter]|jgi:hypothetical protein|uniref:Uncharacterized protein n=1 Tax=Pedobacter roseus TaxID=336820 RepID=A0A7G9QMJ8_9SPHI|nr:MULTISPECIES: hypothetical protein [Pedobacter]QNN44573.1 hypothetical protein H9L23_11070 [Pedobacter roseus]
MKKGNHIVEEPAANYLKAEEDLLKKALSSSYTERFHTMARLMKLNMILKSATIVHKKID